MQTIWRKTIELPHRYPVLWAPYVIVFLCAEILWRLRGLSERAILRWFSTTHSVIVGDISSPSMDKAALTKALIVYAPIGLSTIILIAFFFVAALLVTNEIVKTIERGQTPDLLAGACALRWKEALVLSIKFLLVYAILAASTAFAVAFPSAAAHYPSLQILISSNTSWRLRAHPSRSGGSPRPRFVFSESSQLFESQQNAVCKRSCSQWLLQVWGSRWASSRKRRKLVCSSILVGNLRRLRHSILF